MNKVLIIMQRELLTRIRKRSFLLLTLLMPFIMVALPGVPIWLSNLSDEPERIAIIDRTGHYAPLFTNTDRFTFERADTNASHSALSASYTAILSITDSLHTHPEAAALLATDEVPPRLSAHIDERLTEQIRQDRIRAYAIEGLDSIVEASSQAHHTRTLRIADDGTQSASNTSVAMGVGMVFTLFIYMFILSYGSMMMQSVLEEKKGRIVEIIVSSVKPWQLLWGKLLGIASVGLLQMAVWVVMVSAIASGAMVLVSGSADPSTATISPAGNPELLAMLQGLQATNFLPIIVCFVFYFIGGYFLYASIFAAIGASVSEQEDTQQFMTPVVLLLAFASYAAIGSIDNPTGPLAVWCSYIPFTSPIVMMVRLPFGVSAWEVVASMAILYATTAFVAWAAGQIYRVGILLYGKKPTLREMLRWITWK